MKSVLSVGQFSMKKSSYAVSVADGMRYVFCMCIYINRERKKGKEWERMSERMRKVEMKWTVADDCYIITKKICLNGRKRTGEFQCRAF